MSLNGDIERLSELCSTLSSQATVLNSTLLADDGNSVDNLKKEIDEAYNELSSAVAELKGYVSTM